KLTLPPVLVLPIAPCSSIAIAPLTLYLILSTIVGFFPYASGCASKRLCGDVTCLVLWLFYETRLDKMLIEGKHPADAQLLHDKEGDAICEGICLVLMTLEIHPPFVK